MLTMVLLSTSRGVDRGATDVKLPTREGKETTEGKSVVKSLFETKIFLDAVWLKGA